MNEIFESILSVSFSGSVIILLVIAVRLLLRKAPRSMICLLWILAGLRLLLPFHIESNFSLQPQIQPYISQSEVQFDAAVKPDSAVIPDQLPPDITITYDDNAVTAPTIRVVDYDTIAATVWAIVACGMVGYTLVSYLLLKRKVQNASLAEDGVYESDAIDSPFLLGYIKPTIYLPEGFSHTDRQFILAHERGHIDRGDNWIKLIGFLCVSSHWFNPLVWLGYHLLCKDIEMACDEHVVKYMDLDSRKSYSAALVNCSTQRRFGACPVAFGEVSVKQRVLSVLRYRKPGFWISLACIVVAAFVAVCFLTNPITPDRPEQGTEQLKKCEDAIQMLQNADTYYMQSSFVCNDPDLLLNSSQHHYWRNGEDQMQRYETPDWEDWYLNINGQHFEKDVTIAVPPEDIPYPQWTRIAQPSEVFSHEPWIMRFEWNPDHISFLASQTQFDEEIITLSVRDPELESSYQLTFRFNAQTGVLRSICDTVTYESVGTTYTSTTTYAYFSFDKVKIDAVIQQNYLETQLQTIPNETD